MKLMLDFLLFGVNWNNTQISDMEDKFGVVITTSEQNKSILKLLVSIAYRSESPYMFNSRMTAKLDSRTHTC